MNFILMSTLTFIQLALTFVFIFICFFMQEFTAQLLKWHFLIVFLLSCILECCSNLHLKLNVFPYFSQLYFQRTMFYQVFFKLRTGCERFITLPAFNIASMDPFDMVALFLICEIYVITNTILNIITGRLFLFLVRPLTVLCPDGIFLDCIGKRAPPT